MDESSTIEFPEGLPGFEECRRFVPLQHPERAGLVFLQSLERTELCFLALPARAVRPDYELALSGEDTALLGFPEGVRPALGSEVLALAILCLAEGQPPTANLLAPVVIATAHAPRRASHPAGPALRLPRTAGSRGGDMLVIRRHPGESILIGGEIELEVIECGHNRVKLGIRAPQHIPVMRAEVRLTREQNLAAARSIPGRRAEGLPVVPLLRGPGGMKAAVEKLLREALAGHEGGGAEEAERLYSAVLERDPSNADAWHLLSRVSLQRGDWKAAAARVMQAIRQQPAIPAFHTSLGEILAAQGRSWEASLCYQEALRLAPGYTPALVNLGNALQGQGQYRDACVAYWRAIQAQPDCAEPSATWGTRCGPRAGTKNRWRATWRPIDSIRRVPRWR